MLTQTYGYGETLVLPETNPTLAGHRFEYWYTYSGYSDSHPERVSSFDRVYEDMTIHANMVQELNGVVVNGIVYNAVGHSGPGFTNTAVAVGTKLEEAYPKYVAYFPKSFEYQSRRYYVEEIALESPINDPTLEQIVIEGYPG